MIYLFDVDGTLTPPRQKIDGGFEIYFTEFAKKNNVYLVSGSDYNKTYEQLGFHVLDAVQGVFSSSGNELRVVFR